VNNIPVAFVEKSKNSKLGEKVAATYASIEATCPSSCKLKNAGCYAQSGFVGIQNARLTRARRSYTPTQIAKIEAGLIDSSFKGRAVPGTSLRLHVSGDTTTKTGVKALASASSRYRMRGGGKVWTYSHAWKKLPRKHWGEISVLASVDSIAEAHEAIAAGYAPVMAVPKFQSDKAYEIDGIKFIPCPAQTKDDVTCSSCKLCMNAKYLESAKAGILFEAHGASKSKIKLRVI
jgi:hypothetical protein